MTLPAALLDTLASAAVREGLADAVYTRLETPIGTLLLVQGDAGVLRVGFATQDRRRAARADRRARSARGSSPPTASSPRPATRSPPTSRARTSRSPSRSTSRWSAPRSAARRSRRCAPRSGRATS